MDSYVLFNEFDESLEMRITYNKLTVKDVGKILTDIDQIYTLICKMYFEKTSNPSIRIERLVQSSDSIPSLEIQRFEEGSLITKFKGSKLGQQILASYIVEAAQAVIDYGFNVLKVRRIEASTFETNHQSIRVCEKLGFVKEGLLRNSYLRYDGIIFNKVMFSMTDVEFYQKYKLAS